MTRRLSTRQINVVMADSLIAQIDAEIARQRALGIAATRASVVRAALLAGLILQAQPHQLGRGQ